LEACEWEWERGGEDSGRSRCGSLIKNWRRGRRNPFYQRVNELLEEKKFDEFAEKECAKFYAAKMGRPSLTPGIYFRLLLVGYLEGIDSKRGITWRATVSLGLRKFRKCVRTFRRRSNRGTDFGKAK
jgi:hypothetical protein